MPFLRRKFSNPKMQPRKANSLSNLNSADQSGSGSQRHYQDLGLELGPITANLGGHNVTFRNGEWVLVDSKGQLPSSSSKPAVSIQQLQEEQRQLQKDNQLLKTKMKLLLDWLAERTAQVHLQENEIDMLRNEIKNSVPAK